MVQNCLENSRNDFKMTLKFYGFENFLLGTIKFITTIVKI